MEVYSFHAKPGGATNTALDFLLGFDYISIIAQYLLVSTYQVRDSQRQSMEGMMALTAKEAAEQVGLSKAAILKAIRTGKISAQKDYNGEWRIEPSELFRRYTPVTREG